MTVFLLVVAGVALAVVPWMRAFIWAFKPTDVIDIRNFPGRSGGTSTSRSPGSPEESLEKPPSAG